MIKKDYQNPDIFVLELNAMKVLCQSGVEAGTWEEEEVSRIN